MRETRRYGQFCGLARALDHVGDRWMLLVVRELLLGPQTFASLQSRLGGISPNLLVDRLHRLIDDGLVERNDAPVRSKSVEYRLTSVGTELEAVVLELIRWGTRWMMTGPDGDQVEPEWAPLALRALLEGLADGTSGTLHVVVDGTTVTVSAARGRRTVRPGRIGSPDAVAHGPLPLVLAVAAGAVSIDAATAAGLTFDEDGDRGRAALLLGPLQPAGDP